MLPRAAAGTRRFSTSTGPIPCQRALFDIPETISYLNAAYIGPTLSTARDEWQAAAGAKSSPWEITKEDFYEPGERLRASFARLIGSAADDVALQPSASYGTATAAANVRAERGQNVVTRGGEHVSNRFIWQQVADERSAPLL